MFSKVIGIRLHITSGIVLTLRVSSSSQPLCSHMMRKWTRQCHAVQCEGDDDSHAQLDAASLMMSTMLLMPARAIIAWQLTRTFVLARGRYDFQDANAYCADFGDACSYSL